MLTLNKIQMSVSNVLVRYFCSKSLSQWADGFWQFDSQPGAQSSPSQLTLRPAKHQASPAQAGANCAKVGANLAK